MLLGLDSLPKKNVAGDDGLPIAVEIRGRGVEDSRLVNEVPIGMTVQGY